MKHVSILVLSAVLGFANVSLADSTHTTSGGDVTVTATGGAGGAGGRSDANAIGFGGNASNRTDVDTNVQNANVSGYFVETNVAAPDVKGMGKELQKHASSAAEVRGQSSDGETPCGDVSGISAQSGIFGGAFAVPSVACQTFRHEKLQDLYGDRASVKAEAVLFWFPGFLVRLVTYPISH